MDSFKSISTYEYTRQQSEEFAQNVRNRELLGYQGPSQGVALPLDQMIQDAIDQVKAYQNNGKINEYAGDRMDLSDVIRELNARPEATEVVIKEPNKKARTQRITSEKDLILLRLRTAQENINQARKMRPDLKEIEDSFEQDIENLQNERKMESQGAQERSEPKRVVNSIRDKYLRMIQERYTQLDDLYRLTINNEDEWGKFATVLTIDSKKNVVKFIYIVNAEGEIKVAEETVSNSGRSRMSHAHLAYGRNVYGAGELVFKIISGHWQLVEINNSSGHYQPYATDTLGYVLNIINLKYKDISTQSTSLIVSSTRGVLLNTYRTVASNSAMITVHPDNNGKFDLNLTKEGLGVVPIDQLGPDFSDRKITVVPFLDEWRRGWVIKIDGKAVLQYISRINKYSLSLDRETLGAFKDGISVRATNDRDVMNILKYWASRWSGHSVATHNATRAFVVFKSVDAVGVIFAHEGPSIFFSRTGYRQSLFIDGMEVHPEYRNKDIQKALLIGAITGNRKAEGRVTVALPGDESGPNTSVESFYKGLGFKTVSESEMRASYQRHGMVYGTHEQRYMIRKGSPAMVSNGVGSIKLVAQNVGFVGQNSFYGERTKSIFDRLLVKVWAAVNSYGPWHNESVYSLSDVQKLGVAVYDGHPESIKDKEVFVIFGARREFTKAFDSIGIRLNHNIRPNASLYFAADRMGENILQHAPETLGALLVVRDVSGRKVYLAAVDAGRNGFAKLKNDEEWVVKVLPNGKIAQRSGSPGIGESMLNLSSSTIISHGKVFEYSPFRIIHRGKTEELSADRYSGPDTETVGKLNGAAIILQRSDFEFERVESSSKAMTTVRLKSKKLDAAMNGGIDLTPANMNLQTQNSGERINFVINPAQLTQLQNASGFVPVIINIKPMTDLRLFLGLSENQSVSHQSVS